VSAKIQNGVLSYAQYCRPNFCNLWRHINEKAANSSILTFPLLFDDSSQRKASLYLQIIYYLYWQKLESPTYILAAPENASFCNRVCIRRTRSSTVDNNYFGTNQKCVCDFLSFIYSNLGPIIISCTVSEIWLFAAVYGTLQIFLIPLSFGAPLSVRMLPL